MIRVRERRYVLDKFLKMGIGFEMGTQESVRLKEAWGEERATPRAREKYLLFERLRGLGQQVYDESKYL